MAVESGWLPNRCRHRNRLPTSRHRDDEVIWQVCDAVGLGTHNVYGCSSPPYGRPPGGPSCFPHWAGSVLPPAQVGRTAIATGQPLEVAIDANADNARQLRVRVRQ
jgi:hypothetical protein